MGSALTEEMRAIVMRVSDGILIVGLDGSVRFANPAAEQLLGRSASELTATKFGIPLVVANATEIDVRRPDGRAVFVDLRVVDIEWEGTAAQLVSLHDVTDRKRSEEQSAQLERERIARIRAEAGNQAKSEFLAIMSHELRTPLNAIIGYAELLDVAVDGPLNRDQSEKVRRILVSGRHLLDLVNQVLDFARIDSGDFALQADVAFASRTADDALARIQPFAEGRGVNVQLRCACASQISYVGDEARARQILMGLLDNAVKYTPPGGRVSMSAGEAQQPDESVRVIGSGPWVYFRITDTGIGIPAKRVGSIFEPFVQVESGPTRSADGSGLGLALARRLARLMGGDLCVSTTVGRGSTFTLWLPAAYPASTSDDATSANEHSATTGLGAVGVLLLHNVAEIADACAERMEADGTRQASAAVQPANHTATSIANVAGALVALDEGGGKPSTAFAESLEIERAVAERHGADRARHGWTTVQLHREWTILRDEMEHVVQQSHIGRDEVTADALRAIGRFLEEAERVSVAGFIRAQREQSPAGAPASTERRASPPH
ncbi:MAG: ATP-binding protein [bacterium]